MVKKSQFHVIVISNVRALNIDIHYIVLDL